MRNGPGMPSKATNISLLVITSLQVVTGIGAFLAGAPAWVPVVWLHSLGGFTLILLFWWKRQIIGRSLARRPLGPWAAPGVALLAMVIGALATGVGFSTIGLPPVGGYPVMTIHVIIGVGLFAFLAFHAQRHWPRLRRSDLVGRRALLRSGLLLAGGAALWQGSEGLSHVAGLSGAGRRFSGSRLVARFTGNEFPSSIWLFDDPAPIDVAAWRLSVHGHVLRPLALRLDELAPRATSGATLDCTGGWYTEQDWGGVRLGDLLERAGLRAGARSVVVRASTGYWRRYTLAEARGFLLASHVGGEPLSHEHGAPLRLVAPGRRGFEWVKWVTAVEVSAASPLLNWPLPIR
jgi:hypothetical protein